MAALKIIFVLLPVMQCFYCYTYGIYKPDLRLIYQGYFSLSPAGDFKRGHRVEQIRTNETIDFVRAEDVSGQEGIVDVLYQFSEEIDIYFGARRGKGFNITVELYHDDSIEEYHSKKSVRNKGTAITKGTNAIWKVLIIFGIICFAKKLKI